MTQDATCDLRGLRVDDALGIALQFLDQALHKGHDHVFVIHGHGTGALRDAVRKELAHQGCVRGMRPATATQGGDGVTAIAL